MVFLLKSKDENFGMQPTRALGLATPDQLAMLQRHFYSNLFIV